MTVDEALALVETALDDDSLNDVQEFIFRQCWEGRQSYEEIAQLSRYDDEYIKSAAAKLWKLLSEAFGEKVKKGNLQSVIKRYARSNKVNLQRNLVIEVNLSGANLSGANLSGARVVANFIETDLSHADSGVAIMPEEQTDPGEEIRDEEEDNQEIQSNFEQGSHYWNGWHFRSDAEVKIAEALDRAGVLFFPNAKARLTTPEGRQNLEPDFLICYEGKLGILEVGHEAEIQSEERDIYQSSGIRIVQYYDAIRCNEQADIIVQEFLDILRQA